MVRGDHRETKTRWYRQVIAREGVEDAVVFLDKLPFDELLALFGSVDVMLLPTRHEGSPRAVKEAMASGLPVVTSPISGNRASDPHEEAIVVVPEWSPQAYAQAIERVLEDPSFTRAHVEAGRRVVRERFSLDRLARLNLAFYEEVFAAT